MTVIELGQEKRRKPRDGRERRADLIADVAERIKAGDVLQVTKIRASAGSWHSRREHVSVGPYLWADGRSGYALLGGEKELIEEEADGVAERIARRFVWYVGPVVARGALLRWRELAA